MTSSDDKIWIQLTRLHRRQNRRNARKLRVKVTRIRRAGDLRNEGRRNPLVIDVFPVDVPEEGMAHDLLGISWARSKAQLGFTSKELLENGYRVLGHMNGVERFIGQNGIVDFVLVLTTEGRLLEKHLIDQDAKGPPVHCPTILLVQENLKESARVNPQIESHIPQEP